MTAVDIDLITQLAAAGVAQYHDANFKVSFHAGKVPVAIPSVSPDMQPPEEGSYTEQEVILKLDEAYELGKKEFIAELPEELKQKVDSHLEDVLMYGSS